MMATPASTISCLLLKKIEPVRGGRATEASPTVHVQRLRGIKSRHDLDLGSSHITPLSPPPLSPISI